MNKIIFVSGNLERGGAQRVMSLLANEYASKGWKASIAVLLDAYKGYDLSSDVKLIDLSRKGSYLKNILPWMRNLRSIFQRERPNVIVSFVGRINLITMVAAAGLGIPVIVSERNDPARDRRGAFEVWLCKLFYSHADRIVFQTNYQKNFYGNKVKGNAVIIGNPIAARPYNGEHPVEDLVAVGKLMEQKDHAMLIRGFGQIAEEFPGLKLHIYGEGAQRLPLQQQIQELKLEERILLEGNCKDIFSVMQKNRYFVMTSRYEGLSNALLEAMVSGMVCISTQWDGIQDVLRHGENGYLVPCGDHLALADCLRDVLGKDHTSITAEAVRTGEQYLCESIMGSWFDAIESVIK